MNQRMSGAQAIRQGLITEADWRRAIAHPWTWVQLADGRRVREIPWQGVEIERGVPPIKALCPCCGQRTISPPRAERGIDPGAIADLIEAQGRELARLWVERDRLGAVLEQAVRYLEHPDVLAVTSRMALHGQVVIDQARAAIAGTEVEAGIVEQVSS